MARKADQVTSEYTRHDAAIWHTRRIVAAVLTGQQATLPRVATTFPPTLGHDELLVASGPIELLVWRSVGDGTYTHQGGFFFATGAVGLAATAVAAGAQVVGNAARRAQAQADAQPRWVLDSRGLVTVSTHGFYLEMPAGLLTWGYGDVHSMELVGPGAVRMHGQSVHGPVQWLLQTDWAELLLALWAVVRHPHHPQLVGEAWIPPGWHEREAARLAGALPEGARAALPPA